MVNLFKFLLLKIKIIRVVRMMFGLIPYKPLQLPKLNDL